jgi:hypothetical protein
MSATRVLKATVRHTSIGVRARLCYQAGYHESAEDMIYVAIAAGLGLVLVAFGALFAGLWALLVGALLAYLPVGMALGMTDRNSRPVSLATALATAAFALGALLLPGAVFEAGARALTWPAGLLAIFALSFGGVLLGRRLRAPRED